MDCGHEKESISWIGSNALWRANRSQYQQSNSGNTGGRFKGAQIVCLPEFVNSPYFCQQRDDRSFDLAEPVPGPTTAILREVASTCNVAVITSLFEKAEKFYNTAVVIDTDGNLAGKYRKMHIPDDPNNHYDEAYYFAPGNLDFIAFLRSTPELVL